MAEIDAPVAGSLHKARILIGGIAAAEMSSFVDARLEELCPGIGRKEIQRMVDKRL